MFANPEILAEVVGLLAGFVFAAIILLLSNPPKNEALSNLSTFLFELVVVGLCFTISAFLYGLVDIRVKEEGFDRAFLMLVIASCVGTLGVAQMYHGLAWFFWVYGVETAVISKMRLAFRATLLLLSVNLIYMLGNLAGKIEQDVFSYLHDWTTILWIVPFFIPFVLAIPLVNSRMEWLKRINRSRVIQWVSVITLLASISMAIYAGVVFGFALDVEAAYGSAGKYVLAYLVGLLYCAFEVTLPGDAPPAGGGT